MITFVIERVHENAKMPSKAYPSDAGFDVYTPINFTVFPSETRIIKTGIKIELKEGWEAQIRNKSGIATKRHVIIPMGTGTIDANYRNEIMVPLRNLGDDIVEFAAGDKIAQMIIKKIPEVVLTEGKVFTDTDRGEGGFGSTGER